ncbi:hypothetical protein Q4I30_006315 [Leishmania utingensis]|uniref:Uncharacterized protein n=1 Tax=Leishmania utingensis TaxID=653362 RepID=A0AAW3A2E6_9TRYP
MLGGPTRSLHVLWGQTLARYVPPHSPSGLVRGHLLHRYPVSGAVAASSPVQKGDAEVEAYVSAAEWLPARTPAEVVLNANEFSTVHAVPTASPEDVRWCTRYLLATSSTTAPVAVGNPPLCDGNVTAATVMSDLQDTATSTYEASPGRKRITSAPLASIITTLCALRHVLGEHQRLLAGAEALQTGVPISCILAELEEAQLYLTWSLGSHQSDPLTQGVLPRPCDLVCGDGRSDHISVSAGLREAMSSLADGRVFVAEGTSGGAASAATSHQTLDSRERGIKERVGLLLQRFQREVACLHSCGPRGILAEAPLELMPINAEGAQGKPFLPPAEPRVPLLTVVTSTGRSLAAAMKAVAVAWACCACGVRGNSASPWRCCVYAADILWRPAPAAAFVATWWTALLHQYQRSSRAANSAGNSHSSPSNAAAQSGLKRHAPPRTGAASEGSGECHSVSGNRSEESSAAASSSSLCGLRFHVLITGGDTVDHFLLPLMAGVNDCSVGTPTTNAQRSGRIDVTAQNDDCGGGDLTRPCRGDAARVSAAVQSVTRHKPGRLAMLLCYGCPAAQVAHLREIHHSCLLRQDMAKSSVAIESREALNSRSDEPAITDRESTAATPAQCDNLPSMERAGCAITGVVELCTEAPAVSMVAALPRASSATAGSSVGTSSALSLSYYLRGADLSLSLPSEPQQLLSTLTASARSMTLDEVAARVFESSLLERPLRHADFHDCHRGTCVNNSPESPYEPQTVAASAALHGGASFQRGWCSLCFAPQTHAPALLSTLAQSHFRQPLRAGHSFDALCRRGPAPSPSHMQMAQEVLRCATRGECTHRRIPQGGRQGNKDAGASSSPSLAPASVASTSAPTPASERACANERSLHCGVLPEVQWKHVCGGFPLPLTAIGGRSTPYFVPCLLFTDLVEVASSIFTKKQEGRLSQARSDARQLRWPAAPTSLDDRGSLPQEAHCSGVGVSPQEALRHSAGEEFREKQRQVACAVAAVEGSVSELRCAHDTEMVGYRGVVAGNYLFVCCYPDAWQDAVMDALMRK